jgi:peptidoglycan hydrolase FlgJ
MTRAIESGTNVNDFAALAALRKDARAESPEALREAARQFESLFTRMMLESMRSASAGDPIFGSDQADFYQSMFDDQLAVELSKGRGLGLADMLVQQLTQSRAPQVEGNAESASPASTARAATMSELTTPTDAGAPRATWRPANRDEFLRELWPHAEAAGRALGVDPRTLLAHAALETGWGRSQPASSDGQSSNNLFGIKATGSWRGDSVGSRTLEFEDGVAAQRVERFRAYASPGESFRDYTELLLRSDRYEAVRGTGGDARAFADALQRAGYATDPDYANKLTAVARQLGLEDTRQAAGLKIAADEPIASTDASVRVKG